MEKRIIGVRLAEAEALLIEKSTGEKKAWADQYHGSWWIETIDTTGLFEIPSLPKPRERFIASIIRVESQTGSWCTLNVVVTDLQADFISCYIEGGKRKVRFSVLRTFDMESGKREPHEFELNDA